MTTMGVTIGCVVFLFSFILTIGFFAWATSGFISPKRMWRSTL